MTGVILSFIIMFLSLEDLLLASVMMLCIFISINILLLLLFLLLLLLLLLLLHAAVLCITPFDFFKLLDCLSYVVSWLFLRK